MAPAPRLSAVQVAILRGMADGLSAQEIASGLRPPTTAQAVRAQQVRIRDRLGAVNQPHAVALALRAGLIS